MRKGLSVIVGIAILLFAYSASADVVTNGLVSWWTFDETSGATAYDSIGDNTGTVNDGTWTTDTAGGASSGALYFNSSANVTVPDANSLEPTTISIEAWIKPDVMGSWQAMVGKDGSYIFDTTTTSLRSFLFTSGGNINFSGGMPLNSATWYHIVTTYDGTTAKIFLNGAMDSSTTLTGTVNASGANLQIGSYVNAGYFEGIIDEVRIYNKALNLSEVQQNYAAIPEPAALLLLGGGLLGLLGLSRHKFSRR